MNIKDLLPVGSVILLKGATKKMMIFGIKQLDEKDPGKEYDYAGVPYPEGNVGSDVQYLFNHSDIGMVAFRGYEDEERETFISMLEDYYNNLDNQE